jgi:hypothetical protein
MQGFGRYWRGARPAGAAQAREKRGTRVGDTTVSVSAVETLRGIWGARPWGRALPQTEKGIQKQAGAP